MPYDFSGARLALLAAGIMHPFALSLDLRSEFKLTVGRAKAFVSGQNDCFFFRQEVRLTGHASNTDAA